VILSDLEHVLLSCCDKVTFEMVDVKRQRSSVNYTATKHAALRETHSPKVLKSIWHFCRLAGDHGPVPQLHSPLVCS